VKYSNIELIGYLGAGLMVVTLAMRTMIPLRVVGIVSNIVQIVFAILAGIPPMLVQHGILLPMNLFRLYEQVRMLRRLRAASSSDLSMDWLLPFMIRRRVAAGQVLFRKGDVAEEMFIVAEGRLRLVESALEIGPGAVVGELGLLAPERRRTQTLECATDSEVMQIGYERIESMHFENPAFGFYFLRLTSARLFQNIGKLETALAARDLEVQQLKDALAVAQAGAVTRP
jgi:CRP-like cAMP-binding protein